MSSPNYIFLDNDRYSGNYSNAIRTAWEGEMPWEVDADDVSCRDFWESDYTGTPEHGKGDTAIAAIASLVCKDKCSIQYFQFIKLDSYYALYDFIEPLYPDGYEQDDLEHLTGQLQEFKRFKDDNPWLERSYSQSEEDILSLPINTNLFRELCKAEVKRYKNPDEVTILLQHLEITDDRRT